jgi:hypothetical protein
MKGVEDTTGNKQSREKSDVFYISLRILTKIKVMQW